MTAKSDQDPEPDPHRDQQSGLLLLFGFHLGGGSVCLLYLCCRLDSNYFSAVDPELLSPDPDPTFQVVSDPVPILRPRQGQEVIDK